MYFLNIQILHLHIYSFRYALSTFFFTFFSFYGILFQENVNLQNSFIFIFNILKRIIDKGFD